MLSRRARAQVVGDYCRLMRQTARGSYNDRLLASRAELRLSASRQLGLEEEVAFYVKKLECIEDACQACPTSALSVTVLSLLHADEAEMGAAAVPVA